MHIHILIYTAHYLVFILGAIAQVLTQAAASASSESNGLSSSWQWIKLHSGVLLPRFITALILAPVLITMVPDAGKLPVSVIYGLGGFFSDRLIDVALYIYGGKLGTRLDTPQMAPPHAPDQSPKQG